MVPPIWVDESGNTRPVRQCPRCGRDAPIFRFTLDHLRLLGWYISQIENGVRKNPSLPALQRLAKALGVPVIKLLE